MALTSLDERELLLPLYEGIHERPLWRTFLRRMLARVQAHRIVLALRTAADQQPVALMAAADHAAALPDIDALSRKELIPLAALRPNRSYALQEWLSPESDEARKAQMRLLGEQEIAAARFIRIQSRGGHDAWLILLNDRKDFGAEDSALLTALAPHLASALGTLAELDALRLRAAIAEEGLALFGVRQAALDREGHMVSGDQAVPADPGGRLPVTPRAAQLLATECAALAGARAGERRLVHAGDDDGGDILLRPCPDAQTALPSGAVAVGASRFGHRENPRNAARIVARTLGLSGGEAALAIGLSRGLTLVEAGAAVNLTPESARNYSKRIYAKTGAAGQADLVRLVLTGLAPLA